MAKTKVLCHSSIAIEDKLYDAFKDAAKTAGTAGDGTPSRGVPQGLIEKSEPAANEYHYQKSDIAQRHRDKKGEVVVLVLAGGKVCADAIPTGDFDSAATTTYLAIVGDNTGLNARITGGVTLRSVLHVTDRRAAIIRGNPGLYNLANVYLYRNRNSEITTDEQAAWNRNATIIDSAAGTGGGVNDQTQFASDFALGGPCDVALGIVISDDPFFRAQRASLVSAVNRWLGRNTNRYVSYPSLIYNDQPNPHSAQVSFGVNLTAAYTTLGNLARDAYNKKAISWVAV
jgi:hypothetical protein